MESPWESLGIKIEHSQSAAGYNNWNESNIRLSFNTRSKRVCREYHVPCTQITTCSKSNEKCLLEVDEFGPLEYNIYYYTLHNILLYKSNKTI